MSSGSTPQQGRGSLTDSPLPNLLLNLYRDRFTGTMRLKRQKTEKSIDFQEGAPVFSESNLPAETLGRQLTSHGTITSEDQSRIDDYVRKKKCREGGALIALGLLDAKQLFAALKDQLRRRIVDCFGWPDGEYSLEATDKVDPSVAPFRTDPFLLVQVGLESHWGMERMLPGLTHGMEQYPRLKKEAARPLKRVQADPTLQDVLARLDGYHKLGSAIGSAINDPRVLSIIWSLDAGGLLEYHEESRQVEDEASDQEEEIEIEVAITGHDDAQKAADAAEAAAAAQKPKRSSAEQAVADAETDRLRAGILALAEDLSVLTHYEVLGIDPEADAGQIKKAYFMLAKTHHPDAASRIGLQDITTETQQVFGAIAEAFGVLSKPESRSDYDRSLSGEAMEIDTERLAQAENLYLKGEVLLKMGNFAGSLEFFAPAVDLWPNECDYQSGFGWALFKKSPSEPEKAREHLSMAIQLKADDAVSHYRLGLVLSSLGDAEASTDHLARAKALDPAATP